MIEVKLTADFLFNIQDPNTYSSEVLKKLHGISSDINVINILVVKKPEIKHEGYYSFVSLKLIIRMPENKEAHALDDYVGYVHPFLAEAFRVPVLNTHIYDLNKSTGLKAFQSTKDFDWDTVFKDLDL